MSFKHSIISSLEEAREVAKEALDKGYRLTLETPYGALSYMGPAYFLHIEKVVKEEYGSVIENVVLNCGGEAGYVLGALREGVKTLSVDVNPQTFLKLSSIALQYEALIFNQHSEI